MRPEASVAPPVARPEVTVVAIAFRRRQFLLDAVRSVLEQRIPSHDREILVVKDFDDDRIDRALRAWGVGTVRPSGPDMGSWICEALRVARGRLVCLLDDDDLYLPDKLAHVVAQFERTPGLGYFHNAQVRFSGSGPFPTGVSVAARVFDAPALTLLGPEEKDGARVQRAWDLGGAFNQSSTVIRPEMLSPYLRQLQQLRGGVTTFLFYAALLSPYALGFEAVPLTGYRVHSSNTSGAGTVRGSVRWARALELSPTIVHDASIVIDMANSSGGGRAWTGPVLRVLARNQLLEAVGSPVERRRDVARRLHALVRRLRLGELPHEALPLFLGVARLVVGRAAIRVLPHRPKEGPVPTPLPR
jgi:Glycosyl transferase family 2